MYLFMKHYRIFEQWKFNVKKKIVLTIFTVSLQYTKPLPQPPKKKKKKKKKKTKKKKKATNFFDVLNLLESVLIQPRKSIDFICCVVLDKL